MQLFFTWPHPLHFLNTVTLPTAVTKGVVVCSQCALLKFIRAWTVARWSFCVETITWQVGACWVENRYLSDYQFIFSSFLFPFKDSSPRCFENYSFFLSLLSVHCITWLKRVHQRLDWKKILDIVEDKDSLALSWKQFLAKLKEKVNEIQVMRLICFILIFNYMKNFIT